MDHIVKINFFFRIPSGYRSFIYCTAIREGGEEEWNFALYRYFKETSQAERQNLLNGMACTKISWLVDQYLDNLLNNKTIRTTDALSGFRNVAIRPDAIIKSWNFFRASWDKVFSM